MLKKINLSSLYLFCMIATVISCSSGGDSSNNIPANDRTYQFVNCSEGSDQPLIYFNKSEFDAANGSPNSATSVNWGASDNCYEFGIETNQFSGIVQTVTSINTFDGCDCGEVSNLVVDISINGQDNDNPYGDGSGIFNGIAVAENAVSYGFRIGNDGDETQNTTGEFSFTLTDQGLNQFPFYVFAYAADGSSISNITNLTIDVEGNGGSGNNDVLVWSDEFNGCLLYTSPSPRDS